MNLLIEIIKFLIYTIAIVIISKYILVKVLRKLAEILELKAKTIGNIAGIATSIPELLTVSFSAYTGLIKASIYNIISSNIINMIQYIISIILNKNRRIIENKAIKTDLILAIITIVIPIIMIILKIESNIILVPVLIILLVIFNKLSNNAHKLYINKEARQENIHSYVDKSMAKKQILVFIYIAILIAISISLYIIGNLLGEVLQSLCNQFNVPEIIVGILLGFITSLPELITFFEAQKKCNNMKEGVVEATSNLLTSNMMNLFITQSLGIIIYTIIF